MLVDSHCHLDFPDFSEELEDIISRATQAGVGRLITISTKVRELPKLIAIAERFPSVYCSVGTHPHHADDEDGISTAELVELTRHPKVVALGEAGLDYFYQYGSREAQHRGFRAHIAAARESGGEEALRFLRDPTRGGLTTVLAELAEESGLGIEVEEDAIPVSAAVRSVCDLLGYDPLTLANEGKMLLVTAAETADAVVAAVRATEYGREARRIGFVTAAHPGRVALRTPFGTRRVLDMPVGELLPRIC